MSILEVLSALANVATVLGVPIFLVSYMSNLAAERKRAEYGTYDALDEKYVEFQRLAVQYPRLDIADTHMPPSDGELSAEDIAVRRTLYQILIATFERAYLMYKDKSDQIRRRQWQGWDKYVESYCDRQAFVDAFFNGSAPSASYSPTFALDFEAYMKKKFAARGII